jgi:hypothetical protein
MPGNILDVVVFGQSVIVSLDNIHQPDSTTVIDEVTKEADVSPGAHQT